MFIRMSFAIISLFVLPMNCWAGRPVFSDLSMGDLAKKSKVVAVMSKAEPFEITSKENYGCERLSWRLIVEKVLKNIPTRADKQAQPNVELKLGDVIEVHHNITEFRDCKYREGGRSSGASFPANSYRPSKLRLIDEDRQFIVFLVKNKSGFALVTDRAYEVVGKTSELRVLLNEMKK